MAKNKRKKTDARPSQPQETERKRSFFSRFFEPVPEDEETGLLFGDEYDDPQPDDAEDDDEFDGAEDAPLAPPGMAAPIETAPPVYFGTPYTPPPELTESGAYVPLGAPAAPGAVPQDEPSADFESAVRGESDPALSASAAYVPLTSAYTPPWRQTGVPLPSDAAVTAHQPVAEVPVQPAFPPAEAPAAPVYAQQADPAAQYAPFGSPVNVYAPPPPGVYSEAPDAFAPQPPVFDPDELPAEEIRLFDDEDDLTDTGRRRVETRMFRTGTGSTTRIHINETEEVARARTQEEEARQREAKRLHEEHAERRNRQKQRQAMLKKLFGNIAFVLFFITAIVVALYYGFLLSDIVVIGNDKYSKEYIVEQSGLVYGQHMLFCDLDEAKTNIEQEPYLQVEQITYIFPSRIRIIISERKEVAGIIGLEGNVIIDRNGYVLSINGSTDMSDLLQVTGISMTGFQLGQRLGEGNDFGTATLIQIIEKLEEYQLISRIKSVDLTTPLAISMTADNGLRIHVGQATDLDIKMSALSRLLPQFLTQNITTGTLYLSAKGGTVYSPVNASANATPINDPGAPNTEGIGTEAPLAGGTGMTDADGDGLDDATGEPYATLAPSPAPTPNMPGGGSDDFSG